MSTNERQPRFSRRQMLDVLHQTMQDVAAGQLMYHYQNFRNYEAPPKWLEQAFDKGKLEYVPCVPTSKPLVFVQETDPVRHTVEWLSIPSIEFADYLLKRWEAKQPQRCPVSPTPEPVW